VETPPAPGPEVSALSQLGALKEETPPPAETPPAPLEDYDLELSETSPLTEKDLDSIVALAEKHNWTKEEATAFIAEKEEIYNRGTETIRNKAMEAVKAEKDKLLADPDFKGEKLKSSLESIDLVVKKYGSPELAAYLRGPGGNSLPLAKMLLSIGKLMASDTMQGKGTGAKAPSANPLEDSYRQLYPAFFENSGN